MRVPHRWIAGSLALGGLLAGAGSLAQEPVPRQAEGTRRALLVCGLPGDDDHRTYYAGAMEKIARALVERCGFAAGDVWVRFGTEATDGDGPAVRASRGLSTSAHIAADAEALRRIATPADAVWVIVLGHGHHDGRRSHLNLPGPDLTDEAFARLFDGIEAREQVFILTTSVSGYFLKPLASPGRVAIAATEADQEVNETLYPLALADVLAAPPPDADRDGDGTLSLFELYLAVAADVDQRYVAAELIATEHPQLDDNGDGRGSEVQMTFRPAAAGPPVPTAPEPPKVAPPPPGKVEAKLGPRDDGARAAQIRVTRPAVAPAQP